MDITQIPPTDPSQLVRRVPSAQSITPVSRVRRSRRPWDEAAFVAAYNRFAAQLGRHAFGGSDAKLSELALLYERSSATTLDAFAANMAAAQTHIDATL